MSIVIVNCRGLMMKLLFTSLVLALNFIDSADAGKEKSFCNICRVVVEEANWKISQSDPKRTVQVGSFRVDPHGNQNIKEKTYARSESHVEEIFESVCEEFRNYANLKQEDGSTSIVRTNGRHGKRLDTKDYNIDMTSGQSLRYKCHDFLENHEEDVMALLQREDIENYEEVICGAQTSLCSGKELSVPLIELPEAVEEVKPETEPETEEDSDSDDDDDEDTDEGDKIASEFEDLLGNDQKDEL